MTPHNCHPCTLVMLANPANRAIVAFVRQCGAANKSAIDAHLHANGIQPIRSGYLSQLAVRGVLVNTTPRSTNSRYVLGDRAALFLLALEQLQPTTRPQPKQPQPDAADTDAADTPEHPAPPAWVGQQALPPQYDVMRAPVYVPSPGPAMRPGATDFLACPSRGSRC